VSDSSARPVLWVHDEMLGAQHPAFESTDIPGVPRLFVFDTDWLRDERLSLKRVVFMYEAALELKPITIRKGPVVDTVAGFARGHEATRIVTAWSSKPRIKRQIGSLRETIDVAVIADVPLVRLPDDVDLKRFSRYWKQAKKTAFDRSG